MKYSESTEIKGSILVFNRESSGNPPQTFQVDTCSQVFRDALHRLGWQNPDEVGRAKSNHTMDAASYARQMASVSVIHNALQGSEMQELRRKLADAERQLAAIGMPKPLTVRELERRVEMLTTGNAELQQEISRKQSELNKTQAFLHKARADNDSKSATIGQQEAQLIQQSATIGRLQSDNKKLAQDLAEQQALKMMLDADNGALRTLMDIQDSNLSNALDQVKLRSKEVDQLTKDLTIAHEEIQRLRETGCNAVLANRIAELERKIGGQHE